MRRAIYLRILIKFLIYGRITFFSSWLYIGRVILGRLKCIQPNHLWQTQCLWNWSCYWEAERYKSLGVDQIPAKLVWVGGETLRSEIHEVIKLIWNKENCLTSRKSQLLHLFPKGNKTDSSNYRGISVLSTSNKILSNIPLSRLIHTQMKLLRTTNEDFEEIGQRLIIFSLSCRCWKKLNIMVQYISYM
jgi:hypothetical protein